MSRPLDRVGKQEPRREGWGRAPDAVCVSNVYSWDGTIADAEQLAIGYSPEPGISEYAEGWCGRGTTGVVNRLSLRHDWPWEGHTGHTRESLIRNVRDSKATLQFFTNCDLAHDHAEGRNRRILGGSFGAKAAFATQ
jgi:hypothetical protein